MPPTAAMPAARRPTSAWSRPTGGELLVCAHHARVNEDKLRPWPPRGRTRPSTSGPELPTAPRRQRPTGAAQEMA
ncbi:hypothetical protein QJS66_05000 [Kocuria rhizophila]|nr:hypothetical protein QJS66_05000 [Kocuria rhizophila]